VHRLWKANVFFPVRDSTENLTLWSGHSWRRHAKDTNSGQDMYRLGLIVTEYGLTKV